MTEADEVYALGQLIWQMTSRRMTLVEGWQHGTGLPRDCPPAVIALIQACTDPVLSARPSLKALAKGLDAFWQRAEQGLSDATPAWPVSLPQAEKEEKYASPAGLLLAKPAYEMGGLYTGSPLSEIKKTDAMSPPVLVDLLAEGESEQQSHGMASLSSSSTASLTTSVSQSVTDSILASGSLNLLLIDDQTVPWLSPTDPRYQIGVKLCALRNSVAQPAESKASLPALQAEIQQTLMDPSSPVDMLLWLGEEGEDPSHAFTESCLALMANTRLARVSPG